MIHRIAQQFEDKVLGNIFMFVRSIHQSEFRHSKGSSVMAKIA